jgi:hypothetical protein
MNIVEGVSRSAVGPVVAVVLGLLALLAACGTDDSASLHASGGAEATENGGPGASVGPDGKPLQTGLPCDVDNVFRTKCQTCHGAVPNAGASVSLVTQADLQRDHNGKKVFQRVAERIHAASSPMPPAPGVLTQQETTVLDDWIAAGAPSSTATCAGEGPPPVVHPLSCKPDVILQTDQKFVMPGGVSDVTMCYGISTNAPSKRHIIAFAPHVDNPKIVHHILIFKSLTPVAKEMFPCSVFGSLAWELVAGWAPGGANLEFPPEAGYPDGEGPTNWVIQVHYNNASGKNTGELDSSGYEFCTTPNLRPNDAGVAGFGTLQFVVPPRAKYAVDCAFPATPEWFGKTFFTAFPHMHKMGASVTTELLRLGGKSQVVTSTPNFDYNAQINTPAVGTVQPGDIFHTKCAWKNTTDLPATFGENTEQEMCFNFLSYYPKIPAYPWITPSLETACLPTELGPGAK